MTTNKVAFIVYDQYDNVEGVALTQAEAAYTVWQMFLELHTSDMDAQLDFYGYTSLEDMEEDWYNGGFGWEIDNIRYDEYQVLNELGLE